MSEYMCSNCGGCFMYCACENNPLSKDKLSLNGAGGVTRRMTDKERIQELEKQLAESVPRNDLADAVHSINEILRDHHLGEDTSKIGGILLNLLEKANNE